MSTLLNRLASYLQSCACLLYVCTYAQKTDTHKGCNLSTSCNIHTPQTSMIHISTHTNNTRVRFHRHNHFNIGPRLHTYLWQLLGNISSHKHAFPAHPQVMHHHLLLNDVRGVGQLLHPHPDILLEGCVVPGQEEEHNNFTEYTLAHTISPSTIHTYTLHTLELCYCLS